MKGDLAGNGIDDARVVRVIVADDHPIVCSGLTAVLSREPGFVVVGQARDGEAAYALIEREKPQIAVLDIRMPRLGGLELVERARAMNLETSFVVLTMLDDATLFSRAMDLEVEGYVLKDAAVDEIVLALTAVARGERYVGRAFLRVPTSPSTPRHELAQTLSALTPTELVVLRHLAANKTSRQIAEELGVSVRTVQNHRANVCEKLELRGTNKLLQFALENKTQLATAS